MCVKSHDLYIEGNKTFKQKRAINRAFSLTWPAAMEVYWNKRTFLHKKGSALSRLVLDPNIITETRQLIVVDRENANK